MAARVFLGLRARMIAALMLASAVSLVVAAFALLSPLEHRLRSDALETLTTAVVAARPALRRLPASQVRPGSPPLRRIARSLGRREGSQAVILDRTGTILAATDVDQGQRFLDAVRALRSEHVVRGVAGQGGETEARIAVAAPTGRGPVVLVLRKSLEDVPGAVGVVRKAFTVAALIGLASALLLGIGLATRLVRRIRALRDTALRVAQIGPVAEVRADAARDEVGDLTRAFATMQERLRQQEKARRTFVATASHELRTPLSSLQLMVEILREDLDSDPPDLEGARLQAGRSEEQVRRLSNLAAGLLDLSRIDAGVPLRQELLDLHELCRSVIAEFEPRRRPGEAAIELVPGDACWAIADPGSVAQITRILADNALRFAPEGEPVRVSCAAGRHGAVIAVHDEGPGVDRANRERIFERFERVGETGDRGGFGLGLAIGRELARRLGGDLRLDDGQPGATFILELQPAPAVSDAAPASD